MDHNDDFSHIIQLIRKEENVHKIPLVLKTLQKYSWCGCH